MKTFDIVRPSETITDAFIENLCKKIENNERVRRSLPVWGRVHIDRSLPFLCVYRRPSNSESVGPERLVMGEALYVIASENRSLQKELGLLVQAIVKIQAINY